LSTSQQKTRGKRINEQRIRDAHKEERRLQQIEQNVIQNEQLWDSLVGQLSVPLHLWYDKIFPEVMETNYMNFHELVRTCKALYYVYSKWIKSLSEKDEDMFFKKYLESCPLVKNLEWTREPPMEYTDQSSSYTMEYHFFKDASFRIQEVQQRFTHKNKRSYYDIYSLKVPGELRTWLYKNLAGEVLTLTPTTDPAPKAVHKSSILHKNMELINLVGVIRRQHGNGTDFFLE